MKEELTTAMHSEFTVTEVTEMKHKAFALFKMISLGYTQAEALEQMELSADQVRPHLAAYNKSATKQVVFE
ncbi:hypothetical protein [Fibrella forsythiae]|uniref:Uncharacterized protein n=1 Tax=Fibrella forsythiae TaxID=2817061 RepID=A0ABS3JBD7_9BACT|nr:hypothetical protein [Fibrella forsythiae]MBO0947306.1 hypothetical protein [Fibrella forsythiae]